MFAPDISSRDNIPRIAEHLHRISNQRRHRDDSHSWLCEFVREWKARQSRYDDMRIAEQR